MKIEVTSSTFYKIFNKEPYKIEQKETYEIHHYKDELLEQQGQKIWNYLSSKGYQYYLTDINA